MINLRPYQNELINGLRSEIKNGHLKLILCAPTGAGKTIMFSFMVANHLKRNGKVLIFTHRKELLKQSGNVFEKFNIHPEYIKAGYYPDLNSTCHIAMIETFNRRIEDYKEFLSTRTMIIIDEAHLESFTKIFEYISPNTIVIGATATPFRKGNQTALSEFYTALVQNLDTEDLIKLGYLASPETYGVKIDTKGMKKIGEEYDTSKYYEENKLYIGVVENYTRLIGDKKTIIFTSNVKSSIQVCDEFVKNGFDARHIDANTKNRDEIFAWYNQTPDGILCNCGIATTGFDQPDIECIILYMATTSIVKMLQCIGRGSRVTEMKKTFKILDFGNNIQRLGFWEERRVWSLDKMKKTKGVAPIKYCPECGAILHAKVNPCTYCGFIFANDKKHKEKQFAELKLLTKKQIFKIAQRSDLHKKAEMAKEKLISPFWVLHQMTDILQAREFIKLMGWKPGFEYMNKNKFKVFQK